MKAIIFSTVFALFLFIVGASNTLACSCDLPIGNKSLEKQIKENYKNSVAVFSGKVTEIFKDPNAYFVKVKFESEKIYKGVISKEVIITTGRGGGDCGYNFEVGKNYLVYAYGDFDNLQTNICQRTSLIEETKDAKVLEKIKKKKN